MNELLNIQKCLMLCDYWRFIDTLKQQLHYHKQQQLTKIQEYKDLKHNTIFILQYKNIAEEIQDNIYTF